jgi:hypothetical protein
MKNAIAGVLAGLLIVGLASGAEAAKKKASTQPQTRTKAERAMAWKLCREKFGPRIQRIEFRNNGMIRCWVYQ